MTDSERLITIISTVARLIAIGETTNAVLMEVLAALKEPPSSDLPDLLRAVVLESRRATESLDRLTKTVTAQGARISALTDQIKAREVE